MRKITPVLALLTVLSAPALADDASAQLPSLALNPPTSPNSPSIWSGLSFGTEMFSVFSKGAKSHVGAGGFVAYDHALDNHWSIGLSASAGFMPYSLQNTPFKGVNYASTQVKLGYEIGQLKPYVTGGLLMTRPDAAFTNPGLDQSLNGLFASTGGLKTSGVVGVGVDYQINSNLSVGVGVQVGTGPAVLLSH